MARNSADLALCRRAISIAVRKHCSASAASDGFCASNSLTFNVMQTRTAGLLSGLRDGSKSLLHHLKSFFGPSDPSEPGGKKGQHPSARRPSGSAPSGDAPVHPGDALLVSPLGDQSSAIPGGRHCRKAHESHFLRCAPSPLRRTSARPCYRHVPSDVRPQSRKPEPKRSGRKTAEPPPASRAISPRHDRDSQVHDRPKYRKRNETHPLCLQLRGKGLPEVENGQRFLQVLIRRDQLAETKKGNAARAVAGQEHRRVFRILGYGQKLVGEFQSDVQLQLPPTH